MTFDWPVVDHERLLVLTFQRNIKKKRYSTPGPDFRMICSKKRNTVRVLFRGEKSVKRRQLDEALRGFSTGANHCYPEISRKDEAALGKWLKVAPCESHNHLMPELSVWISDAIHREIRAEKTSRGEIHSEEVNLCPEEIPAGLVDYIRRVILPEDNVLIYKKGNVRGLCYHCREQVRANAYQRFRQNEHTKCPNCGADVNCLLGTSDRFKVDYVQNVATIQLGLDDKTLFVRQWHILRDPTAKWENIPEQLKEVARYAVRGCRVAKWQNEAKENWYTNTYRYKLDGWTRMQNVTEVFDGTYCFYLPANWRDIVAGTSLQYCDLEGYVNTRQSNHRIYLNPIRFLIDWGRYPAVEKLWKAGYTKLVHERIEGLKPSLRGMIRWQSPVISQAIRFPLRLLKTFAPKEWTAERMKKMADCYHLSCDGAISEQEAVQVCRAEVDLETIKTALRHASAYKVLKYIDGCVQKEKAQREAERERARQLHRPYYGGGRMTFMTSYRDYLQDCGQLGLDLDDTMVLFPRNLEQAHARTTAQVKYKHDEKLVADFAQKSKDAQWMCFEYDGLMIRPAASGKELIEEGAYLNHCVGGYADRMARGTTMILLIREVDQPDIPYYTLQWKDGSIIQCMRKGNKSYYDDPRMVAFIRMWTKFVKKGGMKSRKKTA